MRNLFHSLPAGAQPTEEPFRVDECGIGLREPLKKFVVACGTASESFDEDGVVVHSVAVFLKSRCPRQPERLRVDAIRSEQPTGERFDGLQV
ncbi:hypothetical protein [Microbacterium aurum]